MDTNKRKPLCLGVGLENYRKEEGGKRKKEGETCDSSAKRKIQMGNW